MTVKQRQQTIRLPETIFDRIEELARRMSRGGVPVTRADVHRLAIERGIEQLELGQILTRSTSRKKR